MPNVLIYFLNYLIIAKIKIINGFVFIFQFPDKHGTDKRKAPSIKIRTYSGGHLIFLLHQVNAQKNGITASLHNYSVITIIVLFT